MIVDLIRHGEPIGGRLYRGNQDDALTQRGWRQMLDVTQNKKWDFIASSPLIRCCEFAKYLSHTQHIPHQIFNDFAELGFGDWQGRSAEDIGIKTVAQFKTNPIAYPPPNAENLYNFQTRVLTSLQNISSHHRHKSVLIIAHAGVIRVIKSHFLNLPIEQMFKMKILPAAYERFEI